METKTKYVLKNPPIYEVICGFVFNCIPDLDPLQIGIYWDKCRDNYPNRKLQAPLFDEPSINIGGFPIRAWFISEDEANLIQLQNDRFYVNWRAKDSKYPRCSDKEDNKGLLSNAINEFEKFNNFSKNQFNIVPKLKRIELAKVDIIEKEKHWINFEDLQNLVPFISAFNYIKIIEEPNFSFQIKQEVDFGTLAISIDSAMKHQEKTPALRIESRLVVSSDLTNIEEVLIKANKKLNETFFTIISTKHLDRFGLEA